MDHLTINSNNPIDQEQLERLRAVAGNGPVLILTHDNPDPDSLASGKALAVLLKEAWAFPAGWYTVGWYPAPKTTPCSRT